MNKKQLNKFRMYETVNSVLDTHSDLVATLNPLAAAHVELKAGQATINLNRQVQEVDSTGLTKDKIGVKENVVRMIVRFTAGLKNYAASVNNMDLKTKSNYTNTDLKKVSDSVLYDIGVLINGLVIAQKADMSMYFIGEAEILEMTRLLGEFRKAMPLRRLATTVSKVSTGNIEGLFAAQDMLLRDQIDVLMLLFQFTQPDFYKTYKNARSIVDYSGRKKSVTANIPAAIS